MTTMKNSDSYSLTQYRYIQSLYGFPDSLVGKESVCNVGDHVLNPGSRRSIGEGIGYPLQYPWTSLVAQLIKNPPAIWETWVGKTPWRRERLPTPVISLFIHHQHKLQF